MKKKGKEGRRLGEVFLLGWGLTYQLLKRRMNRWKRGQKGENAKEQRGKERS